MIDLPWVTAESGLPKGAASAPGGLARSKSVPTGARFPVARAADRGSTHEDSIPRI